MRVPWLIAVVGITLPATVLGYGFMIRGACLNGVSFQSVSRVLEPICPGPTSSGLTYSDPRTGPMSTALAGANAYFNRTGVGVSVNIGPGANCVAAEESGTFPGSMTYPFYAADSSLLTFGVPSTLGPAGSDTVLGRVVDSVSVLPGATGNYNSFSCVPLRGSDLARFDVFAAAASRVLPVNTYDDSPTWGITVLHELGHAMGLGGWRTGLPTNAVHDDRWPATMNSQVLPGASPLVGLSVLSSSQGSQVVYKGDGDMSRGLEALGYLGPNVDYGISPQSPAIDPSLGLITTTRRRAVMAQTSQFDIDVGFVVFNHGQWYGGDVFVTAFPDTGDPVLDNFPGAAIHLAELPLPQTGQLHGSQILTQGYPGNLFFRFRVPVDGAAVWSAMTPGIHYRVVLYVTPPRGIKDDDPSDNWVSTAITLLPR